MHRLAISLSVLLAAASAQAADPVPTVAEPGACPKAVTETQKPAESSAIEATATPGATAPVRARSSGASGRPSPRWNSMLPGMIR